MTTDLQCPNYENNSITNKDAAHRCINTLSHSLIYGILLSPLKKRKKKNEGPEKTQQLKCMLCVQEAQGWTPGLISGMARSNPQVRHLGVALGTARCRPERNETASILTTWVHTLMAL